MSIEGEDNSMAEPVSRIVDAQDGPSDETVDRRREALKYRGVRLGSLRKSYTFLELEDIAIVSSLEAVKKRAEIRGRYRLQAVLGLLTDVVVAMESWEAEVLCGHVQDILYEGVITVGRGE